MSDYQNQGRRQVNWMDALQPSDAPNLYESEPSTQVSSLDMYKTSDVPNFYEAANKLLGTTFAAGGAPRESTVSFGTEKTPMQRAVGDIADAGIGIVRDGTATVLRIAPATMKTVGNGVRLFTGDRVGKGLVDAMELGDKVIMNAIGTRKLNEQQERLEQFMANPHTTAGDLLGQVVDNPRAVLSTGAKNFGEDWLLSQIGGGLAKSIAKGRGAGPRAIATAGKVGEIVTDAVSNASNTYGGKEQENRPQPDRYAGAAESGLISLMAGILGDRAKGDEARRSAAGVLKTFGVDRIQDTLKEYGNAVGESAAHDQMPDLNSLGKRMVFSGAFGSPP